MSLHNIRRFSSLLSSSYSYLPSCVFAPSFSLSRRFILTDIDNTDHYTEKLKGKNLKVVQYSALWCAPCKQIKPQVRQWSRDMPEVDFLFVDIDSNGELCDKESISSVPTFLLFKNGIEVDRIVGASVDKLKNAINKHKDD